MDNGSFYGVIDILFTNPQFWLIMLITTSVPILLEIVCRYIQVLIAPTYTHGLQKTRRRSVVIPHSKEEEWKNQNHIRSGLRNPSGSDKDRLRLQREKGQIDPRTAVRAMLRFQNLTGSLYASAANHVYQTHDEFRPSKKDV